MTAVPGAPPMYQAWLAAADAAGSDADLRRGFAAVRIASCGAAPLPVEVWTAMRDRAARDRLGGLRPHRGRAGRGEHAGHRAAPSRPASAARSPAWSSCCGTPPPPSTGPGTTRRGPAATTTPPTRSRRGRARSGCAAPTSSPATGPTARTARTPTAGCAPVTSPTATRDGDLHLVDRRSDLILVSGFNVYPAEVERVLDAHPAVAESAVIGGPDAADRFGRPRGRRPDAGGDADLRGAAGARRRLAGPLQGADVGALPAVAAALADREGQPRAAARAGPHRGRVWPSPPGPRMPEARLELLTRAGCHLCVAAAETLTRIGGGSGPGAAGGRRRRRPGAAAPSTATASRWCCWTAASTPTSRSTSSG